MMALPLAERGRELCEGNGGFKGLLTYIKNGNNIAIFDKGVMIGRDVYFLQLMGIGRPEGVKHFLDLIAKGAGVFGVEGDGVHRGNC